MITEGHAYNEFTIKVGSDVAIGYDEVITSQAEHEINIGTWPNLNLTINQITDIDGGLIM